MAHYLKLFTKCCNYTTLMLSFVPFIYIFSIESDNLNFFNKVSIFLNNVKIFKLHNQYSINNSFYYLNDLTNLKQSNKELDIENKNLRELLDFKRETKLKIIPASIINKGIQTNIKALTIDVGSRDGVFTNQAVLTPYGVIGKTIQVGKNSAIVQSISDNNFRLSVRIMPSGAVGILRWFDSNTCKVYEIQKNVEVNIGDRVITSGFSKIYPPKLPVGTVSGVYDERGSYQKVINVSIQNDFESIQNVFIVLGEK